MLDAEQHEKLAKACHADQPGTAIERWRALCVGALCQALLARGRDITILVGPPTSRARVGAVVVMAEDRN